MLLTNLSSNRSPHPPTYRNRFVAQHTCQHTDNYNNLASSIVLRTRARRPRPIVRPKLDQHTFQLTEALRLGFNLPHFRFVARFVEDFYSFLFIGNKLIQ